MGLKLCPNLTNQKIKGLIHGEISDHKCSISEVWDKNQSWGWVWLDQCYNSRWWSQALLLKAGQCLTNKNEEQNEHYLNPIQPGSGQILPVRLGEDLKIKGRLMLWVVTLTWNPKLKKFLFFWKDNCSLMFIGTKLDLQSIGSSPDLQRWLLIRARQIQWSELGIWTWDISLTP